MPEGDTVLRTARRLDQALSGQVLTRAELRWDGLSQARLAGRDVLSTIAYGKHLFTRVGPAPRPDLSTAEGPLTIHSHLRMDGQWLIQRPDTPVPTGGIVVRAVLGTERYLALGRLLGMLDLFPTADERLVVNRLGPDIMADDFPTTGMPFALDNLAATPARTIGAALLDQSNLAGIGTMYMAEALFLERLSPWTPAGEVPLEKVVQRARTLLLRGANQSVPTTTGDQQRGRTTFVHSRSGKPCRRCGTNVRVAPIGEAPIERVAFWCPRCQPGPTPTDHGRPQAPLGTRPRTTYRPSR